MERKSIGIQFYGRRNPHRYLGTCPQCNHHGPLASYATQRWFGIGFLPLIPLGTRYILDHCPSCQHLREFSQTQWDETRRTSQAAAAEATRRAAPGDPAPAIRLHGLLTALGNTTHAEELRSLLEHQFPDHPEVRAYLDATARLEDEGVPPLGPEGSQGFKRFAAVIGILLALVFAISNHYISRNRVIHVVNGWEAPITIQIDDGSPVSVPPGSILPLAAAEGTRVATLGGAAGGTIRFVIDGGVMERWFGNRYFVLNPGGAALLLTETTAPHPLPSAPGELNYTFHAGTNFLTGEADHLFTDFPSRSPSSGGRARTRLAVVRTAPAELFYSLMAKNRVEEAIEIAEWGLRRDPEQGDLLGGYINVALRSGREKQMREFMKEGAGRRPVQIQWHRAYQSLAQGSQGQKAMTAEYDRVLSADPGNSALLYLRGRLSSSRREANPYYERAVASDPANAFAHHALGYNAASSGDWERARGHLARAGALRPGDEQMQELFYLARFALGEFEPLKAELSAELAADPLRLTSVRRLSEVLIALGQTNSLAELSQTHHQALAGRFAAGADPIHAQLQIHIAYAQGDFDLLEKLARNDASAQGRLNLFQALTELGRFDEATNSLPLAQLQEPFHVLAFALAEDGAGRTLSAVQHLGQAHQGLIEGPASYAQAAQLLSRPTAPASEEVLDLTIAPQTKAVLLVALSQRFGDRKPAFLELARTLNVSREFPHHLLNRLIRQSTPAPGSPAGAEKTTGPEEQPPQVPPELR